MKGSDLWVYRKAFRYDQKLLRVVKIINHNQSRHIPVVKSVNNCSQAILDDPAIEKLPPPNQTNRRYVIIITRANTRGLFCFDVSIHAYFIPVVLYVYALMWPRTSVLDMFKQCEVLNQIFRHDDAMPLYCVQSLKNAKLVSILFEFRVRVKSVLQKL